MPSLVHQRCRNHASREAVARCPECQNFFCRECIAEHDDQVLCAGCLQKRTKAPLLKRRSLAGVTRVLLCLLGLLAAWIFFFVLGESLLSLPDAFHEGTLWHLGSMSGVSQQAKAWTPNPAVGCARFSVVPGHRDKFP